MTEILCKWLNNDLLVSTKIDAPNFAREFSSGFLIGEVLAKYQLQDDFDQFSQNRAADSKLNNFTRLEPVLHLLEVPFDTNVAHDIMTERHGIATRLMYQLFIALNKKQKSNLTGVAMETMRPAAPAKLEAVESLIYKERLKKMLPRQTDLDLNALVSRFHEHQIAVEQTAFRERFEAQQRQEEQQQEQRQELLRQHRDGRARREKVLARIRAAEIYVPKRTATKLQMTERQLQRRAEEAQVMREEIDIFEEKLKRTVPPSKPLGDSGDGPAFVEKTSNEEYIGRIRSGLNEDAAARKEREKRRRKVLVDQMKAHEAQENARREEMLVGRLLRQSQQERRIAVQLLQTRREKDAVQRSRQRHMAQCEERRRRELDEALNREAEVARLATLEYVEQRRRDLELHDELRAEQAHLRYRKHYDMCCEVLADIVNVTTRVTEYRGLTGKLLPPKLMRDWKELFVHGLPIYDVGSAEPTDEVTPEDVLEHDRQQLLNEADFTEYRNMTGSWAAPTDHSEMIVQPRNNPIVGHIVQRLNSLVSPPGAAVAAPNFPAYPVRACILGKAFAGKTTAIKTIAESHNLEVLQIETLVQIAMKAFDDGEQVEVAVDNDVEEVALDGVKLSEPMIDPVSPQSQPAEGTGIAIELEGGRKTEQSLLDASPSQQQSEQEEKSDPEKPVDEEYNVEPRKTIVMKSTDRAELGCQAQALFQSGAALPDELLVDILVEAIRCVPVGTGWVIDGFPTSPAQAVLLEKALTGYDDSSKVEAKVTQLAPDPHPVAPPPEPGSGIDVAIVLQLDDEICLKRAAGRTRDMQTNEQFQPEFHPPPVGCATGIGGRQPLVPLEDPTHDADQVQQRLMVFTDLWPRMETWFNKFGILKTVDSDQLEESVCLDLELVLDETIKMVHGLSLPTAIVEVTDDMKTDPDAENKDSSEKLLEDAAALMATNMAMSSAELKVASPRALSGKKSVTGKTPPRKRSSSAGRKSTSPSRASSSKIKKRGRSEKNTPDVEPDEAAPSSPHPIPGSDDWQYVAHPLDTEVSAILVSQWDVMESTYLNSAKQVFQGQRKEREIIVRFYHQIREDYLQYLRRPDSKQEFIIQWQEEFNEVSDDVRADADMRAELHQRVDTVRERLWSVCDTRREQAAAERRRVVGDGWLDDRLGLLVNAHVALVQLELDRLSDTVRLLRDYYRTVDTRVPDAAAAEYTRVPLVELLPTEAPLEPEEDDNTDESEVEQVAESEVTIETEVKTAVGKATSSTLAKESHKSRIPLVPRRPTSPDATAAAAAAAGKVKVKKTLTKESGSEECRLPAPTDPDEKLIYDAYLLAMACLDGVQHHFGRMFKASSEQAAREEEAEAEREREAALEMEKKAGKKGKGKSGKKSRSPSARKGKGKEAPLEAPTPVLSETEEDRERRRLKERAAQEFHVALLEEIAAARTRTELIVVVCCATMRDLRTKADAVFKDMDDWLGSRFLKEMQSIDLMSEVMRQAVESAEQIKEQLVFEQEDFLIDEAVLVAEEAGRMLQSPDVCPSPPAIETAAPDTCTALQILKLYEQFALTAPDGIISQKAFQEIFLNLVSVTSGVSVLPESWVITVPEKIEALTSELSVDGDIDWRGLLLVLASPWPVPSQQNLLDTLHGFEEMDQQRTGYVSREQYDRMELWFNVGARTVSPDSAAAEEAGGVFDRLSAIKDLFFTIFSETDTGQLPYLKMLLYFSATPDPYVGLLRALSVAIGEHLPHLPSRSAAAAAARLDSPSQHRFQTSTCPDLALSLDAEKLEGEQNAECHFLEDIPASACHTKVPIDAFDLVLQKARGTHTDESSYRFNVTCDTEDIFSKERLVGVYHDLGSENGEPILFTTLLEHPVIQDIISMCTVYKTVDVKGILSIPHDILMDNASLKATD